MVIYQGRLLGTCQSSSIPANQRIDEVLGTLGKQLSHHLFSNKQWISPSCVAILASYRIRTVFYMYTVKPYSTIFTESQVG